MGSILDAVVGPWPQRVTGSRRGWARVVHDVSFRIQGQRFPASIAPFILAWAASRAM